MFATFPRFGAPTDEAHVRRWPMNDLRYTIFYRITHDETIEALRIIDSKRRAQSQADAVVTVGALTISHRSTHAVAKTWFLADCLEYAGKSRYVRG